MPAGGAKLARVAAVKKKSRSRSKGQQRGEPPPAGRSRSSKSRSPSQAAAGRSPRSASLKRTSRSRSPTQSRAASPGRRVTVGPREEAPYDTDQPVKTLNDSLKDARRMLKKAQRARKKGNMSANHPEARPGQRGRSPTPHPKKGQPAQSPPDDRAPVRLAPAPWAGGAMDQQRTQPNRTRNAPAQSGHQAPSGSKKKWWSGAWSTPRTKSSKGKGKGSKKGRGKGGKSTGKTFGRGRR